MKSTKFSFFLIFFLISFLGINELKSQHFKCGTPPPTEAERADIIRKLREQNSNARNVSPCTDIANEETKTYKLILEYSADEEGQFGLRTEDIDVLVEHLNTVYNAQNIFFEYYFLPILCPNCEYDDPAWERENPLINKVDFQNCLWGRITNKPKGVPGGTLFGVGNISYGRFWGFFPSSQDLVDFDMPIPRGNFVAHELGHALGLLHTHDNFNPYSTNNEYVKQQQDSQCGCNCKISGDFICDTNVDPYYGNWNGIMFSYNGFLTTAIVNADDEVDNCGTSYDLLIPKSNEILNNAMSYHQTGQISTITSGQASYIKAYNSGKPWDISGLPNSGGSMEPGFVVNQPMEITSPMNLTGNIEIKSKLTIKNTSITFLENRGITIKPGGELILDNGHLSLYGGMECLPAALFWNGIAASGPGLIKVTAKNGSTINGAKIALNIKNATFLSNISDSRINSYFDTALDVIDGKGKITIHNSFINGVVRVKNFFSGLDIIRSYLNTPSQLDPKIGGTYGLSCENATLQIRNSCSINSKVYIFNTGSQIVRLSNSRFSEFVNLSTNAVTVIRENTFYSLNNLNGTSPFGLEVKNNRRIDLYANVFTIPNGTKFEGHQESSPMLFKNKFITPDFAYQNDQSGSLANIFCNDFQFNSKNSIELNKKVNANQGSTTMAAGNYFSQSSSGWDIRYRDVPKIDYFFRDIGIEEPKSNFGNVSKILLERAGSTCDLKYPITPSLPTECTNGIKDGNETNIDCGGSCPPCNPVIISVAHCTNGVLDIGETGIDCGGPCPPCLASCNNGLQDNGETGIDCGGPCPPCPFNPVSCSDGIMNGNETGVDCGGPTCPPCNTSYCNNQLQDNGEAGIDCGGPCPPCGTPHCNNGIQDGNETGIDCGGSCPPCVVIYPPTCYNGIQDGNETGIDCGGSCPPCVVIFTPSCYNGIKDGNEIGIDCGGSCPPCGYNPPIGGGNGDGGSGGAAGKYVKGNHIPFISSVNEIYGTDFMTIDKYKVTQDFATHNLTLDGGNTCALHQFIRSVSPTKPNDVIQHLLTISPNVSVNAIHVLFENSQFFTSTQVAQIIKLNPAVLSDRYISEIVYNTNTFSANEKTEIINSSTNDDNRKQTEILLNFKKQCQESIIRDNISILSLNEPYDFNAIRSELATDPGVNKFFDIAQTYADQGRSDLAIQTLAQMNPCQVTDPIIKAQVNGLMFLYQNWTSLHEEKSRNTGSRFKQLGSLLNKEHGLATDMAAQMDPTIYNIKERWKYEPLTFKILSNEDNVKRDEIRIYPNPVTSLLNIELPNNVSEQSVSISIYNTEGKMITVSTLSHSHNVIDVSDYFPGVYTVKISNNIKALYIDKFIKLK